MSGVQKPNEKRMGIPKPAQPPQRRPMPVTRDEHQQRAASRARLQEQHRAAANQQPSKVLPHVRPAAPPARVMPNNRPPTEHRVQPTRPQARQLAAAHTPSIAQAPKPSARPKAALTAAAAAAPVLAQIRTAGANPQISTELNALQNQLSQLQTAVTFSEVKTEMDRLDKEINDVMDLLESARKNGYYYQRDLDEIALAAMERWQSVAPGTRQELVTQSGLFQSRLSPLNSQISQLNAVLQNPAAAANFLRLTQTQVNTLLTDATRVKGELSGRYRDASQNLYKVRAALTTIHWILKQLGEAKFKLASGEEIIMAVQARWDQVGDNDPEGILYLTTQRLLFEQKEKVAKKKVLFLTTAKELVHQVLVDVPLVKVGDPSATKRGLFGNQDFLEMDVPNVQDGKLILHLNGQDARRWVALVNDARSGQVAQDRTKGSLINYKKLVGELTQADILGLQVQMNDLQDNLMLKDLKQELSILENDVHQLQRKLSQVRAKGYAIERSLEQDIAVLVSQWEKVKGNTGTAMAQQERLLSEQGSLIQAKLSQLMARMDNLSAARPLYMEVKSAAASAQAQADAARDTVLVQFDAYDDHVESLLAHLEWINWMLVAIATASFKLMATESGVAAVEAMLVLPDHDPQNGILFLTDQRVIWENRVESVMVEFEAPLQWIESVRSGRSPEEEEDDLLLFELNSKAPYSSVTFDMTAPVAAEWLKMIGRARNGDYAKDRAIEIDQSEIDRLTNAPTACSNCSASFTTPILRGQREILCDYCGSVTRF